MVDASFYIHLLNASIPDSARKELASKQETAYLLSIEIGDRYARIADVLSYLVDRAMLFELAFIKNLRFVISYLAENNIILK